MGYSLYQLVQLMDFRTINRIMGDILWEFWGFRYQFEDVVELSSHNQDTLEPN